MVNYAKHQLLRKAEEFSRICSGSNNPFDWITVGGYATCIKDECTIVVSKLLARDMFKKSSMQEII
ncbi:hypothetical protein H5410_014022 [Solanum commersonii]|uniref:Uncharacterized protein n=1 Tax=Solanum commersonii TaxID=4109 RepID=A0A9J5ZPU6_SOLCO|nr:hypothetical protein H5410_014022 [Solanum commersonii]